MITLQGIRRTMRAGLSRWIKDEEAVAAVEAALVFPIMLTMLLGVFDMGNAILINQKAIRASQVTADLVTRDRSVSMSEIDDAIDAGRLSFVPFSDATYGIDVVSIRFDGDANPQIVWRETRNMTAMADVLTRVADLAQPNDGVVVVAVQYDFVPVFAGFVMDSLRMQEVAFARGRKSAVVDLGS